MIRLRLRIVLALSSLSALAPDPVAGQTPPPTAASPAAPQPAAAAAAPAAPKRARKPLVATVLPGTRSVPGYPRVREYTSPSPRPPAAPALVASTSGAGAGAGTPPTPVAAEGPPATPGATEPPLEPVDFASLQITELPEALVLARPFYPSALQGAIATGTRARIRGQIHARSARGCSTRLWYALEPFGYVCSRAGRPSSDAPTTTPALAPLEGSSLPYRYVMVLVKEGDKVPMWPTLQALQEGEEPERHLEHGDTVAVERALTVDGEAYWLSVEGKVFPRRGSSPLEKESAWHGEVLDDKTQLPFGWTQPARAGVWAGPIASGKPLEELPPRTRVAIAEEAGEGKARMLRIGEGRWVKAGDVNEVRRSPRPEGITAAAQWIDVDLGEQTLVAYQGEVPVYATLTSSGRAIPTPRGNYPVWAKVTAISMKSQPYEDKAYFVNKVPWVLFFQAHNAIHGAYWHDRFGVSKSHGCVNVSPLDARHLFEWLEPALPPGWTGYRFEDLLAAPTVHVHNSHARKDLVQERPIGPPDKELEAQKLEDAEERRAAAALTGGPGAAPAGMAP